MTSTTTMIIMVSMMLAMNVGMVMFQAGVTEANPVGSPYFFNASGSPYANYASDDALLVDDSYLPSDDDVEQDDTGNIITDTYRSIKSWTRQKLSPLGFVTNVLEQPYGFLRDLDVPVSISLAVGVIWYLIAIIIIVSWWMGR